MQSDRPIHLPPEPILRAYMDLICQSFLYLRANARKLDPDQVHALADALHNLPLMLMDYGAWIEDEKYRELYLRPFDRKWGAQGLRLEELVQRKIQESTGDR